MDVFPVTRREICRAVRPGEGRPVSGDQQSGAWEGCSEDTAPSTPACASGSTPRPRTCRTCSEGTRTGQSAESPVGPHRPGVNRSPWARHCTSRRSPQEAGPGHGMLRPRQQPLGSLAKGVPSQHRLSESG